MKHPYSICAAVGLILDTAEQMKVDILSVPVAVEVEA
jgi:hypothetical protein